MDDQCARCQLYHFRNQFLTSCNTRDGIKEWWLIGLYDDGVKGKKIRRLKSEDKLPLTLHIISHAEAR